MKTVFFIVFVQTPLISSWQTRPPILFSAIIEFLSFPFRLNFWVSTLCQTYCLSVADGRLLRIFVLKKSAALFPPLSPRRVDSSPPRRRRRLGSTAALERIACSRCPPSIPFCKVGEKRASEATISFPISSVLVCLSPSPRVAFNSLRMPDAHSAHVRARRQFVAPLLPPLLSPRPSDISPSKKFAFVRRQRNDRGQSSRDVGP